MHKKKGYYHKESIKSVAFDTIRPENFGVQSRGEMSRVWFNSSDPAVYPVLRVSDTPREPNEKEMHSK